MSDEKQVFWSTGEKDYFASNSRMYRDGDLVYLEIENFDREDVRRYDYSAIFKWVEYLDIIRRLKKGENVSVESMDRSSVSFSCSPDGSVEIMLFGSPSPCSSPGGTSVGGCARARPKLEELFPK